MTERLKELGISMGGNSEKGVVGSHLNSSHVASEEDDNAKAVPPIDYEFAVGMTENGIDQPKLRLPEAKNPLYVTKPIDNYEPMKAEKQIDGKVKKSFNPDPN